MRFDKSLWYCPHILFDFINETLKKARAQHKTIPGNLDKLMKELWTALWFIPGIYAFTGRLYYVQPVDPDEQTPDIRTMYEEVTKAGRKCITQDVEIATYSNYSNSTFEDFVIETKYNVNRPYPEKTILLFVADNTKKSFVDLKNAHLNIQKTGLRNHAYAIAKFGGDIESKRFNIAQIAPRFTRIVNYNAKGILTDLFPEYKRNDLVIKAFRAGVSKQVGHKVENPFLRFII